MKKCSLMVFFYLFLLPGCGSDDTPTRANDFTPLTSLVIESKLGSLAPGTSTQLIAKGNYSGQFVRDITREVIWNSDLPAIADFPSPTDLSGRIRAAAPGRVTVTASLAGISVSYTLIVTDATITALVVSPESQSLPLGLTQAFTAEGIFTDDTRQDLTFDADWSISDTSVATIGNEYGNKGVAQALKIGSTEVSAAFAGQSDLALLSVTDAVPLTIDVIPASISALSLTTQALTAIGEFSDGSSQDITTKVQWESGSEGVVSISPDGTLKALAPGVAVVTASFDSSLKTVKGSGTVKVTGGRLQSVALTLQQAANNRLIRGSFSRISARGTFDNGTIRDITGAIDAWDVEDAKVAISDSVGNLLWIQALEDTAGTTISATYGNVPSAKLVLKTDDPVLTSLTILDSAPTLSVGTSARLSLAGIFTPSTNQNLSPTASWSSGSLATATVGGAGLEGGRVRALASGTAEITANYGGKSVTTTVTVVARILQSLKILPLTFPAQFIPGAEKLFKAEALYTDGTRQDVTADTVWIIDNPSVAIFSDQQSDPGLIVAVDAGSTTLRAKFGGREESEAIVVFQ